MCAPGTPPCCCTPSCLLSISSPPFLYEPKGNNRTTFLYGVCDHTSNFLARKPPPYISPLGNFVKSSLLSCYPKQLTCFSAFSGSPVLPAVPVTSQTAESKLEHAVSGRTLMPACSAGLIGLQPDASEPLLPCANFSLFSQVLVLCFVSSAVDQERLQLGPKIIVLLILSKTPDVTFTD